MVKNKLKVDCIYNSDCLSILKKIPDKSISLIVTSPPYADNRKKSYCGVPVKQYVEWFLPISEELRRVLKSTGSLILNIKERATNGERGTYVLELILAMKEQGWLWTEEYIWHKRNSYPGKWPNRFRDSWERCLHFTKQKKFSMYQKAVMVQRGEWAKTRLQNLSIKDKKRVESNVQSGFTKNVSNWIEREKVYPTNVLHFATVCSNVNHPAAFPKELPTWFIKLFTRKNDVVLDPFLGIGTTALVAKQLQRRFIGIEISPRFYKIAMNNVGLKYKKTKPKLKIKKLQKIIA